MSTVRRFVQLRTGRPLEPWQRPRELPIRRAQALRIRLGGDPNLEAPFPPKPRWMRWRTYDHHIDRLEQLEAVANARLEFVVERLMRRAA